MAKTLFRRLVTATPDSTLFPFVALNEYWDSERRTVFRDQEGSANDDPSELAPGTELDRWNVRAGVARVVRYGGDGQVYTRDEAQGGGPGSGGACTLGPIVITPNPATTQAAGTADAGFTVAGQSGVPPYEVVIRVEGESAVRAQATSASAQLPAAFANFGPGTYTVTLTDAANCAQNATLRVYDGSQTGAAYGTVIYERYTPTDGRTVTFWNPRTREVESFTYPPGNSPDPQEYDRPVGSRGDVVDKYLADNGYGYVTIYNDGNGGVYSTSTDTRRPGLLALNNLIIFHPDRPQDATGGAVVEVDATDFPLAFALAPLGLTNTTGRFDGLPAGDYTVTVQNTAGQQLSVPVALRARYGRRWQLMADDVHGRPWAVEIWQRGYAGPTENIFGDGNSPVVLKTDGLSSANGGQGDVPAAVGSSCELRLLVTLEQLQAVQLGEDRDFRVDVWAAGALEFRGYVTPDIYTAPLLDGLVSVELTATDGLAALKETDFTGHVGQRLTGRWPVLHTLLHCLSRCDVALPVGIAVNRRPAELATADAPELLVLTERAGYAGLDEKGEVLDMRQVLEAEAQLLGGTLVQRGGRWEIRSALEAAGARTPTREYGAAGQARGSGTVAAPAGVVLPPAARGWHWVGASQQLRIRAGWKSLAAKTDVGYAKNALPAGDAFGDADQWNSSLDDLLPTAGWTRGGPGSAAVPVLPLLLVRAGDKDTDLGTLWPEGRDENDPYLQSGLLPNAPLPEDTPWEMQVVVRLVRPGVPANAPLPPENQRTVLLPLLLVVDGIPTDVSLQVSLTTSTDAVTLTRSLPPLPAGARISRLRMLPWRREVPGKGGSLQGAATMVISKVAFVLKPQGATWAGKDNFRIDADGGTLRPTEPVAVFHADVPLKAGLFEGNSYAFRRSVSVLGGALTTTWARALDGRGAPLLATAALDSLALRAGPSRLLAGAVRFAGAGPAAPLRMLDAVDAPYDVDGRRFLVAALSWDVRAAESEVSLVEVGAGARQAVVDPYEGLPNGVRLVAGFYFLPGEVPLPGRGRPHYRATDRGVRVRG